MKTKTINAVICKKFDEWLESIKDEEVKKLVAKNTIITGGSIASMINNEKVKDFDVYFTDIGTTKAVAEYYVNQFNEAKGGHEARVITGKELNDPNGRETRLYQEAKAKPETDLTQYEKDSVEFYDLNHGWDDDRVFIFIASVGIASESPIDLEDCENPLDEEIEDKSADKPKYRPVFLSSNAITLSDKIQLVVRFYGDADKIHDNFDYVHATNYWTSQDRKVVMRPEAYEACHNKELLYIGSKYPVCSLFRMRKFLERGFTIHAGEILKICMNINEFNLTNVKILRDQLIGVDSSYFNKLISAIKSKESIDRMYLTTIINKMYN
jgi:hypothetical protein